MLKRIVCALLCLCTLVSMCPVGFAEEEAEPMEPTQEIEEVEESAEEQEEEEPFSAGKEPLAGNCGEDLTWSLDEEGILTISGSGDMPDYNSSSKMAPWYEHRQNIRSVYVDQGVTRIGAYAFYDLSVLDWAMIGEDVKSIGRYAFSDCGSLEQIDILEGLSYIEESAFRDCGSLTSIWMPDTVVSLGEGCFYGCNSLKNVRLSQNLTRIESSTFYGCASLEEIALPNGLQGLGDSAFRDCEGLKTITIPEAVSRLEGYTFQNCTGLQGVTLPEHLTSIGSAAFAYCTSLKEIHLPSELSSIGGSAFLGCSGLEQINIPEKMTSIPEAAFYGCTNLTVQLPSNLKSIGRRAFYGCPDCDIIDLSNVPTAMRENIVLTGLVNIPELLSSATGGLAELTWSVESVPGEGSVAYVDGQTLCRIHPGQFRLVCTDSYTGIRGSKVMEVTSNLEIRPEKIDPLPGGQSLQLTAVTMPGEAPVSANWSLAAGGEQSADISADGLLTAKNVAKETEITVIATISSGDTAQKTVTILPRVTGVSILVDGNTAPDKLYVDMKETKTLSLSATVQPDGAKAEVEWASGQDHIASVDRDGTVTLLSPGRTVIYARSTDGSGIYGELLLVVRYVDKAETLTLRAAKTVLESGEQIQLMLSGEEDIPAELVTFSVLEDGKASIDEQGIFTAGDVAGYVNVTAMITGDPLQRKASVQLRIKEPLAHDLRLIPEFPDDRASMDDSGLYVDSRRLEGKAYTFRLKAQGCGASGNWTDTENVTFESTNASLAAVSADGTVTVKAKAEGESVLIVRSGDSLEAETRLKIVIQDRSPRLESSKLTLNSYRTDGISTALVESYANAIQSVEVYDYNKASKSYQETPSQVFAPTWEDGTFTLEAVDVLKGGTYPLKLTAVCDNGTYDYLLQVKVTNTFPKVTVKQGAKFNLFYLDSTAPLTVTAGGYAIEELALTGVSAFRLHRDGDNHAEITYGEDFIPGTNVNKKGKLSILLEGYRVPIEQNFTLATVNTQPKLTVNPAASVLNLALNSQTRESWTRIYQNGQPLDLSEAEISSTGDFVQLEPSGEHLIFRLTGEKGGTVSFLLRLPNWAKEIKLSHKITVETKLPKLTLASGTLKLNSRFPGQRADTALRLSQSNLDLGPVSFVSTAKTGSAAEQEANKLALSFDPENGMVSALIRDGQLPKAGTYGFLVKTSLADSGTDLPAVTLKITVTAAAPKVTLSAKGKLDTLKPDSGIAYTVSKLTNCPGPVEAMALEGRDADKFQAELDNSGAKTVVNLKLLPGESYDTRTTYKVQFRFTVSGQNVSSSVLNVKVTQSALKVTVPKTIPYYRGQSGPIRCNISSPVELAEITLGSKTNKTFLQALGDQENISLEGNRLRLRLADPSALKVGKSYTVCLSVIPEGNAVNVKPTQVKLTVKVMK